LYLSYYSRIMYRMPEFISDVKIRYPEYAAVLRSRGEGGCRSERRSR
uniref:KTSC domain-containing protein n=1 Tax=Heligmosomoides polygyrus TaxID=6339 RepID=A0A183GXL9_HELPZ